MSDPVENPTPNPEAPVTPEVPTTPNEPEAPEVKTFTQEQVNRFNTKAKKDGEAAAMQALLKDLGVEKIDEAKDVIKAFRDKQDAEKTENQRLQEAYDGLKSSTESEKAELAKELHTNKVKLRLARAGVAVPEGEGDDVQVKAERALDRLVGMISVERGASVEDIDSNIAELKEEFPALFESTLAKREGNPASNPSGTPRKPSLGTVDPYELGKKFAEERGGGATSTA